VARGIVEKYRGQIRFRSSDRQVAPAPASRCSCHKARTCDLGGQTRFVASFRLCSIRAQTAFAEVKGELRLDGRLPVSYLSVNRYGEPGLQWAGIGVCASLPLRQDRSMFSPAGRIGNGKRPSIHPFAAPQVVLDSQVPSRLMRWSACAVKRRWCPAGGSPARELVRSTR
jgi:hypothetical protein